VAIFQMILFFMGCPMHSGIAKTTQGNSQGAAPTGHVQRKKRRFKLWPHPNRRQACPAKPGWSSNMAGTLYCSIGDNQSINTTAG
jgi:hypothetical protein